MIGSVLYLYCDWRTWCTVTEISWTVSSSISSPLMILTINCQDQRFDEINPWEDWPSVSQEWGERGGDIVCGDNYQLSVSSVTHCVCYGCQCGHQVVSTTILPSPLLSPNVRNKIDQTLFFLLSQQIERVKYANVCGGERSWWCVDDTFSGENYWLCVVMVLR